MTVEVLLSYFARFLSQNLIHIPLSLPDASIAGSKEMKISL